MLWISCSLQRCSVRIESDCRYLVPVEEKDGGREKKQKIKTATSNVKQLNVQLAHINKQLTVISVGPSA